jgi:hypothetical protein
MASNLNPNNTNPHMYIRNGRQVWLTDREVMIARELIPNDVIIPADSDIIIPSEQRQAEQRQATQSQSSYQPFHRTMPKRVRCPVCCRMMRPGHHH